MSSLHTQSSVNRGGLKTPDRLALAIPDAHIASNLEGLGQIKLRDTPLASFRRPSPEWQDDLAGRVKSGFAFRSSCRGKFSETVELLRSELEAAGLDSELSKLVSSDVRALAESFAGIVGSEEFYIALKTQRFGSLKWEDLASFRYHRDRVPITMLCTYAGPGSRFTSQENVDAESWGDDRNRPKTGSNQEGGLLRDPTAVYLTSPFEVTVHKGETEVEGRWKQTFPGHVDDKGRFNHGSGIPHAGPALAEGESRFNLSLFALGRD